MFLMRLMVLAVAVVMLLPVDPASRDVQSAHADGRSADFCSRYPKTCDATGEIWSAFKRKLAYGIRLARQSLATQTDPSTDHYGASKFGGKLGEWRPPADAGRSRYDQDSWTSTER